LFRTQLNSFKITYCRSTTDDELKQILDLQQKNLFSNVSEIEQKQEGFVTVSHSLKLLKAMNNVCPHIIAKAKDKVVGYALCMHPMFSNKIDVLKPMFQEIETLVPRIEKYIVMGQVCVDQDFRKKGIFRNLYGTMQNAVQPEFKSIITGVDAKNERSLQAHYAIGFKLLKSHVSDGHDWQLITLKT